jgi:hypothetical protein
MRPFAAVEAEDDSTGTILSNGTERTGSAWSSSSASGAGEGWGRSTVIFLRYSRKLGKGERGKVEGRRKRMRGEDKKGEGEGRKKQGGRRSASGAYRVDVSKTGKEKR